MLGSDVTKRAERRVGQMISGKWRLDRVIGVGGMAAVYEATHRNQHRVAIKLLHPEVSLDVQYRERFSKEAYLGNSIPHGSVVRVHDDGVTDDGLAYLVMDLLKGETVDDRIHRRGGRLEPSEALSIADKLLELLTVAHEQGVLHRDIKPENLFITEDGELKVLDFGLARQQSTDIRSTQAGSFMGTPAFCAPEQARGRWDSVDARSDLYAVGASLFTMLTGAHVHDAETASEQLALAISSDARSLRELAPDLASELIAFVDQSLAYDKAHRFQSARAMRSRLARVRANLGESGLPPPVLSRADEVGPPSSRPSPLSARTSLRVSLGVFAALLLGILLFWLSIQRGRGPTLAATQAAASSVSASPGQPVLSSSLGPSAVVTAPGSESSSQAHHSSPLAGPRDANSLASSGATTEPPPAGKTLPAGNLAAKSQKSGVASGGSEDIFGRRY